jgi:hypothetical protein
LEYAEGNSGKPGARGLSMVGVRGAAIVRHAAPGVAGNRRVVPRSAELIVLAIVLLFVPGWLCGHNYLPEPPEGGPTIIPNIAVSRAAYRELRTPGQVDEYRFSARARQEIHVQMNVPVLPRLSAFAPAFALICEEGSFREASPHLTNGVLLEGVSVHIDGESTSWRPEQQLAVEFRGKEEIFHEPFTGTTYLVRQELSVLAPVGGAYRLYVYDPAGDVGKYVLAPGRLERFSVLDVLGLPATRIRVRRFMERPVWGDYVFWSILGAAAVGGIVWAVAAAAGP